MGVYNVEAYIETAISSALSQTIGDFEIIVADDGSTDETIRVIKEIRDKRVLLIENPHRGSAVTRNTALRAARGKYVAFLDGDDLWYPDKLKRHLQTMDERPELDLSFSLSQFIDEFGNKLVTPQRHIPGNLTFESLLIENSISNGSCVVVRRGALSESGLFDEELIGCIDYHLWLRVALLRSCNVAHIPEVLVGYRKRAGQITGDWQRMARAWPVLIAKLQAAAQYRVDAVLVSARSSWNRYLAYLAYEQGETWRAAALLWTALRGRPGMAGERETWMQGAAIASRALLRASGQRWLRRMIVGVQGLAGRKRA